MFRLRPQRFAIVRAGLDQSALRRSSLRWLRRPWAWAVVITATVNAAIRYFIGLS
jgi:hypothetical protein